ncbi:hypothetical protein PR202_gb00614 [Eleusine coracana subsp. coracana]|uniref:Uncharacterized protein n=1 Tax=Eleusine coracana subsp. coracana TaxID=191504 RepID=A0AAV5DTJ5_ELECO|nr:hypothetical protein QOZ80_5BG0427500 [Eleusine coracana subsp. coracana]GJN13863.1 hypothetical protein PR202_gb00614 [Eleusine coracana subsp. coracana]
MATTTRTPTPQQIRTADRRRHPTSPSRFTSRRRPTPSSSSTLVAALPNTARGTSFVTAHSKHGSWIVGVAGGHRAGTIIFDPSTLETYKGSLLQCPHIDPVLLSLAGEVYALSRRPRVVPGSDEIDFEPWFHSLSFNREIPIGGGVGHTYWCELPPPPFFPSLLDPYEFRNPPEISVTAYAALAASSHILVCGVSAQQAQQERPIVLGTYAFHVVTKTWEKVHAENLPFVGQAEPLDDIGGNNLFVACPVNNGAMAASASLFHISIKQASSSCTSMMSAAHPSLSIQEFPVAASEIKVPKPLFCPLGNGTFCSITLRASR